MTQAAKSSRLYLSKNVPVSKVKSVYKTDGVAVLSPKGEAHNTPDKSSSNENFLIDFFYAKIHNLKASYTRLNDRETAMHYYKSHKQEVLSGGKALVQAINHLMRDSKEKDQIYGTHFYFLVVSILHHYESNLAVIGIHFIKEVLHFEKRKFINVFCNDIEALTFLFEKKGLVEQLVQINIRLLTIDKNDEIEGRIIDYRA